MLGRTVGPDLGAGRTPTDDLPGAHAGLFEAVKVEAHG
jgi:hypothetical protein